MPKKRPYGQFCPIATALDRIGDRWSLLIVRELLTGPLRYNELLHDLDGLATDVLARRLRELESLDLVVQQPDGYGLTPDGRQLGAVLQALARWGENHLGQPDSDQQLRASRAVQMLAVAHINTVSKRPKTVELLADGLVYTIVSGTEGTTVSRRSSGDDVDSRVQGDGPTLWALRQGWMTWDEAVADKKLVVEGDVGHVERLLT